MRDWVCVEARFHANIWKWASLGIDSRDQDGIGVHQCHVSLLSQCEGGDHKATVVRVSSAGIQNDRRVDDMCREGRGVLLLLNSSASFKAGIRMTLESTISDERPLFLTRAIHGERPESVVARRAVAQLFCYVLAQGLRFEHHDIAGLGENPPAQTPTVDQGGGEFVPALDRS